MKDVHILLVEDNEGDIFLTREALNESLLKVNVSVVTNGEAAVDYLLNRTINSRERLPDLILLDINLPKLNGIEVLHHIKNNELTKSIPVIMLTTSSYARDITQAYANYANCYITKPDDVSTYLDTIEKINIFWMNTVRLPTN